MIPRRPLRPAPVALLALAIATGAAAREGLVLDELGKPIDKAKVCLLSGQLEVFCKLTGTDGAWVLPDAPATGMRVQAIGYQMLLLPADLDEPIVMERAATLFLRVVDAESGEPLPSSEAFIRDAAGRRRGPAPVNRHGLRLGTMKPGLIRIEVSADGYEQRALGQAMLIKDKTVEVTVKLHPIAGGAAEGE